MKLAESLHALGERHNRRLMHGAKAVPNVDVFNEEAFDLHYSALGKISSGDFSAVPASANPQLSNGPSASSAQPTANRPSDLAFRRWTFGRST